MRCTEYGAAMLQLFPEVYSLMLYATSLKFGKTSLASAAERCIARLQHEVQYLSMNDSGSCMLG